MSIPSGDKVLGQTGHLQDHNDITDVLRDHEERITEVEGASLGIADVSGLQAALDAKAPTEAPTLVGPVEITGADGSTIFSGDDFLMDVASDNPVAGPGMSMTKRREAAAALEVGDAVGYIGYMKGSDSGGDPTLGLQLHVEVDDTVDAGIVPMALVLSQQKADGTFEETHRWNSDGTTTPSSGGGGGLADASRLWTPGSGVNATYSDEFDDASLDGAWTRVDASGGTGRATWTEVAGCLSLLQNGMSGSDASAELHGLVRPYALAVGEYIETRLSWAGKDANYPMAGLVISSGATHGAGTQVFGGMYRATAAAVSQIAEWTNWTTRGSYTDDNGPGNSQSAHLRLKRTATNDYALYTSPDGVSWALLNTRTGVSFTPAYVGLACSLYGATTQFAWSFAYFRVGTA